MIDLDPRVIKRDGEAVVVDANGDELVCRRLSPHAHGTYHRIDCERYTREGTMRPACRVTGVNDTNWRPVRRATIDTSWEGCTYPQCYGDAERATAIHQQSTGSQLRTTLAEMSVEEFEATVAAHEGGER